MSSSSQGLDPNDSPQLCPPHHTAAECGIHFTHPHPYTSYTSLSAQLRTVFHFIQSLREWDFELLEGTLSEEFRMEVLPRSLGIPGRGKEEWVRTCREGNVLEPGYRLDIMDINESPGRIWIHATVHARAKTGQSYENEYLLMFRLTTPDEESGTPKILELKEFMDSLYITNFALDVGRRGGGKGAGKVSAFRGRRRWVID
ncbi:hypothetical protein BXZ70DRAFT_648282 [Cristinia sonorae]|uniref:Uncharacterized protein n=1 Tax=Cristinia sonorae TaxID=1940300 RepID=A0A8K0UF61_9AGAR|nr:hypothetical protein BXZ70DRAFT_648282 [Cristinia sonorae]